MPPKKPDAVYIRQMFDRLAGRYDLFNHLTSLGLASFWRAKALESLKPGMRVLDLGCGTGDLTLAAARRLKGTGQVLGMDFSQAMLDKARRRTEQAGLTERSNTCFLLRPAEELPLEGDGFDLIVSGFVLRNIYENIDRILDGVRKSLNPRGGISFLDITEPTNPAVNRLWKFYMNTVTALYGKLLFGKDYPSMYLTQSAERFFKPAEFTEKLKQRGFRQVRAHNLLFGIITLYRAEI